MLLAPRAQRVRLPAGAQGGEPGHKVPGLRSGRACGGSQPPALGGCPWPANGPLCAPSVDGIGRTTGAVAPLACGSLAMISVTRGLRPSDNSRSQHFTRFKLHAVLSGVAHAPAVLLFPFRTWLVPPSSVPALQTSRPRALSSPSVMRSTVTVSRCWGRSRPGLTQCAAFTPHLLPRSIIVVLVYCRCC